MIQGIQIKFSGFFALLLAQMFVTAIVFAESGHQSEIAQRLGIRSKATAAAVDSGLFHLHKKDWERFSGVDSEGSKFLQNAYRGQETTSVIESAIDPHLYKKRQQPRQRENAVEKEEARRKALENLKFQHMVNESMAKIRSFESIAQRDKTRRVNYHSYSMHEKVEPITEDYEEQGTPLSARERLVVSIRESSSYSSQETTVPYHRMPSNNDVPGEMDGSLQQVLEFHSSVRGTVPRSGLRELGARRK